MMNFDFKKYIKEENNYFSSLADNLGIDFSVMKGPNWLSNLSMQNVKYNGIMYTIDEILKDSKGNITGAYLKTIDGEQRKFSKDNSKEVPNNDIKNKIYVNKDELQKILTQGFSNNGTANGGIGTPPMGGGLPL
jgi:hypothetical protein